MRKNVQLFNLSIHDLHLNKKRKISFPKANIGIIIVVRNRRINPFSGEFLAVTGLCWSDGRTICGFADAKM